MIYEYLKTAFPIYDDIRKQNRFVKPQQNDKGFVLISPQDTLLPFIFKIPTLSTRTVSQYQVINAVTGAVAYNILTAFTPNFTFAKTSDLVTYVMHKGLTLGGLAMAPGTYYVLIQINAVNYYSELFQVHCFNMTDTDIDYTRIEWDNDLCDLGDILYQTGWKNTVFLQSDIHKEDPQVEEEGYNDGLNDFFPTIQKYVDSLTLEAFVPFYLGDALVLMSMHKKVVVTMPFSLYSAQVRNVKTTVVMQDGGYLYLAAIKFKQDTQYINSACCVNKTIVV